VTCPFCDPPPDRLAIDGPIVRVLRDLYPVSDGHLLVIPRRHVASWDDASPEERAAVMMAVDDARALARTRDTSIDGFNIGWNDGEVAGQTVMHLHLHVIPRRRGDVADARGGIRWIFPARARYWTK